VPVSPVAASAAGTRQSLNEFMELEQRINEQNCQPIEDLYHSGNEDQE